MPVAVQSEITTNVGNISLRRIYSGIWIDRLGTRPKITYRGQHVIITVKVTNYDNVARSKSFAGQLIAEDGTFVAPFVERTANLGPLESREYVFSCYTGAFPIATIILTLDGLKNSFQVIAPPSDWGCIECLVYETPIIGALPCTVTADNIYRDETTDGLAYLWLPPGTHEVLAESPGYYPLTQTITLAPQGRLTLYFQMTKIST